MKCRSAGDLDSDERIYRLAHEVQLSRSAGDLDSK